MDPFHILIFWVTKVYMSSFACFSFYNPSSEIKEHYLYIYVYIESNLFLLLLYEALADSQVVLHYINLALFPTMLNFDSCNSIFQHSSMKQ